MSSKPKKGSAKPSSKQSSKPTGKSAAQAPTVSHLLGEMTWLLTQSPLHRHFQLNDLEWLVMPALIHQQFYMFRDGDQPVGLALWAKCKADVIPKLEGGMIEPQNRLTLDEWINGDQIWLVDLIAPFANAENMHREIMMADLMSGPLEGQAFNFHQTDPATGKRSVQTVAADAGEKLKAVFEAAVANKH